MADFRTELVAAALAEQARAARRKETDPAMVPLLRDYWMVGAGRSSTAADAASAPPVGRLISFVVHACALGRRSSTQHSHSVYAGGAIRNQLTARPRVFVGLPPDGEGAVARGRQYHRRHPGRPHRDMPTRCARPAWANLFQPFRRGRRERRPRGDPIGATSPTP
jgi:hypothetical protein